MEFPLSFETRLRLKQHRRDDAIFLLLKSAGSQFYYQFST